MTKYQISPLYYRQYSYKIQCGTQYKVALIYFHIHIIQHGNKTLTIHYLNNFKLR